MIETVYMRLFRGKEFSAEVKMTSPRGDTQKTRVFTEDGIYEITMLAKFELQQLIDESEKKT